MIQMIPWGWQLPNGWIDRECLFSHQAEAVSAWYFNWVNTDRLKGLQPMCAPAPPSKSTGRCSRQCWFLLVTRRWPVVPTMVVLD